MGTSNVRQLRAVRLANFVTEIAPGVFRVPSQSGGGSYVVDSTMPEWTCTCPDAANNRCKHVWAALYKTGRAQPPEAPPANGRGLRKTYPQNWPAYNEAQSRERDVVERLLQLLCAGIDSPQQPRGRPRIQLRDVVYAVVTKVYSTLSARRVSSDLRGCTSRGLLTDTPHYNTVLRYMESEELSPLLCSLVTESSRPMAALERDWAIDSTGFTSTVYTRWLNEKGVERREHNWVKCHAICGTRTHVAAAVEVTEIDVGDAPLMPMLLARTAAAGFAIRDVSADKGYSSFNNAEVITNAGATPYVMFRENAVGANGPDPWRRMFHLFATEREDWLAHYHRRSNVEAVFSSVKRKFGPTVRARGFIAQANEVYAKFIAHNLSMLAHAIIEFGVDARFWSTGSSAGGAA